jgi:hypothetical protein
MLLDEPGSDLDPIHADQRELFIVVERLRAGRKLLVLPPPRHVPAPATNSHFEQQSQQYGVPMEASVAEAAEAAEKAEAKRKSAEYVQERLLVPNQQDKHRGWHRGQPQQAELVPQNPGQCPEQQPSHHGHTHGRHSAPIAFKSSYPCQ